MIKEIIVGANYRSVFDKRKVKVIDLYISKDDLPMVKYELDIPVISGRGTIDTIVKPKRVFEQTFMI